MTDSLTLGELRRSLQARKSLGDGAVLIAASSETVVRTGSAGGGPSQTMVFMHETLEMMRAERQGRVDRLRGILSDDAQVLRVIKKSDSFWDHITVGRSDSADLELTDPAVSNVHAHFEFDKQEATMALQDVGSSNGTFVNREQLQPHAPVSVRSGDCLRFGQSIFYFLATETLAKLLDS